MTLLSGLIIVQLLCKEPTLRLGAKYDATELRNHPFFATINWKKLETKKIDPPLKPHLEPKSDKSIDPWAIEDSDDSFEFLSSSEQDVRYPLEI